MNSNEARREAEILDRVPVSYRRTLVKYGLKSCREAQEQCDRFGEGQTMQSIHSGIPARSCARAVQAYRAFLVAKSEQERIEIGRGDFKPRDLMTREMQSRLDEEETYNDGQLSTAAEDFEEVDTTKYEQCVSEIDARSQHIRITQMLREDDIISHDDPDRFDAYIEEWREGMTRALCSLAEGQIEGIKYNGKYNVEKYLRERIRLYRRDILLWRICKYLNDTNPVMLLRPSETTESATFRSVPDPINEDIDEWQESIELTLQGDDGVKFRRNASVSSILDKYAQILVGDVRLDRHFRSVV